MKKINWLLVAAGVFAGFCNGFFGAGGGMLVVPALEHLGKIKPHQAHASALSIILPLSVVSVVVYFLRGASFETAFWWVMAGAVAGSAMGALLLGKFSGKGLRLLFVAMMVISGVGMIVK